MQIFEKIIEKLEEKGKDDTCMGEGTLWTADAIEIVNQVAEEYNNGWIPCSERLPDEKERERTEYDAISLAEVGVERYMASDLVNVTVKDYDKDIKFVSDDCTVNGEWTNYNYYPFEIIAWQPLPEPYQPKGVIKRKH